MSTKDPISPKEDKAAVYASGYDALANMPKGLREWAEEKGLDRLLKRYGWEICKVCGRIGYAWETGWILGGKNLEFQTITSGWMHPLADGWDGGNGDFRARWKAVENASGKAGQPLEEFLDGLEPELFDLFMKGVSNTIDSDSLVKTMQNKQGVTNPYDFCVSGLVPLATRQGGKRGVCPKCGEPGTGEGVVGKERRFFHEANRSCYLGMVNPVRRRAPEVKCPKCGEQGRKSMSKGYAYIRHKNKTCYVGKISDELT